MGCSDVDVEATSNMLQCTPEHDVFEVLRVRMNVMRPVSLYLSIFHQEALGGAFSSSWGRGDRSDFEWMAQSCQNGLNSNRPWHRLEIAPHLGLPPRQPCTILDHLPDHLVGVVKIVGVEAAASPPPASGSDVRFDMMHGLPNARLSVTGSPQPS